MLTIQHTEEALSLAFVQAVAAMVGVSVGKPDEHDYGFDVSFRRITKLPNGILRPSSVSILAQLKASTNYIIRDDSIIYKLEARAYNHLVDRSEEGVGSPFILILMCLPKNKDEWLELSEEQLILRKCCYWAHLIGEPTDNTSKKSVIIPRSQLFTPDSLLELLDRARKGDLR